MVAVFGQVWGRLCDTWEPASPIENEPRLNATLSMF